MTARIVSVDELCVALRSTLQQHLADTVAELTQLPGYADLELRAVKEWQQLPELTALSAAEFPAVSIASPGLIGEATHSRAEGGYRSTWRINVGIFDRGRDHDETQALVRAWCAAIRLTVRAHRSLDGAATGTEWRGDRFNLMPNRNQARTFAGGAVAFDVSAIVIDSLAAGSLVTSTPTPTVSVQ